MPCLSDEYTVGVRGEANVTFLLERQTRLWQKLQKFEELSRCWKSIRQPFNYRKELVDGQELMQHCVKISTSPIAWCVKGWSYYAPFLLIISHLHMEKYALYCFLHAEQQEIPHFRLGLLSCQNIPPAFICSEDVRKMYGAVKTWANLFSLRAS